MLPQTFKMAFLVDLNDEVVMMGEITETFRSSAVLDGAEMS